MRAIFIGGPLHGETKIVEPGHSHCAWRPPPNRLCGETELTTEVVRYERRISFGDTAIFTPSEEGTDDAGKLIVESIERGLQLSPEPPLKQVIEILFQMHAGHAFFQRPEDETKNKAFLVDMVQSYWKRQQDFKSRK